MLHKQAGVVSATEDKKDKTVLDCFTHTGSFGLNASIGGAKKVTSLEIEQVIKKTGGKLLDNVEVFDLYVGDKIDSNKKSIAYNLTFRDNNRTLTEEEVMEVFNNIITTVCSKLNAELRDK